MNFRLGKDTVNFLARGYISNTLPSFYMRHYHSNHFAWDNDLNKEFRTRIEGELNIDRWRTNLKAGVENIKTPTGNKNNGNYGGGKRPNNNNSNGNYNRNNNNKNNGNYGGGNRPNRDLGGNSGNGVTSRKQTSTATKVAPNTGRATLSTTPTQTMPAQKATSTKSHSNGNSGSVDVSGGRR